MVEGLRDSFIENDVIGNTNIGSSSILGRPISLYRKKRKKSNSSDRKASQHKTKRNRKRSKSIRKKGRGMSKEFLRKLRKKHHLGEFKK